jgi:hypothetical protein
VTEEKKEITEKEPKPSPQIVKPKAKTAVSVVVQPREKDPKAYEKALNRLKLLLDVIYRKEDVRNRLSSILNPEKPQTSSNLTADQVNFVNDALFLADQWREIYQPLADYANEVLLTQLSLKGYGVDQSIKLVGAIEGSGAFKAMFGSLEPQKKRRLPSFNRGDTKQ